MIYPHQQQAMDYITQKFLSDPDALALLISGSIMHGFHSEKSDVDFNVILTDEAYAAKQAQGQLTYFERCEQFYADGYFDGKFFAMDYLDLVAQKGNEPTRFALHNARIAFDRTGLVAQKLKAINAYPLEQQADKVQRFLSQLYAWKWYTEEALAKQNQYLLDTAVTKLILFGGRLILADNCIFFPYHKWFLRVLQNAPDKPQGLMQHIDALLKDKSAANIQRFYDAVVLHKDWMQGQPVNWSAHFVRDVETNWMRGNEYIENI